MNREMLMLVEAISREKSVDGDNLRAPTGQPHRAIRIPQAATQPQ